MNNSSIPGREKEADKKILDSNDRLQYDRLTQDWRQIHNIIWGIPSVAVSIFTGVIVAAYGLHDLPRIIVLGIGSIFLFAMTVEVVKKSVTMDRIYKRIRRLDEEYEMKFKAFPSQEDEPNEDDDLKGQISNSPLHRLFRKSNARTYLVYVCFTAAIKYLNYQ
jgi:hypothetical protein